MNYRVIPEDVPLGKVQVGTSNKADSFPPESAARRKYSSNSLIISNKSLLLLETTTGIPFCVALETVILENPLTADGGAATLADPTVVVVTTVSDAAFVDIASHSSSRIVSVLSDIGMNGSQKSHVDDGGGGGGGGGGRGVEEVFVVDVVHASEDGLMGGGGGGGGSGAGGVGGEDEGRTGGKWSGDSAVANWRRAAPVFLKDLKYIE